MKFVPPEEIQTLLAQRDVKTGSKSDPATKSKVDDLTDAVQQTISAIKSSLVQYRAFASKEFESPKERINTLVQMLEILKRMNQV